MAKVYSFLDVAKNIKHRRGDKYGIIALLDPELLINHITHYKLHYTDVYDGPYFPNRECLIGQAVERYWFDEYTREQRRELIDTWIMDGSIVWTWQWLLDWKGAGSGGIWDSKSSRYFSWRVHCCFTPEQKLSMKWITLFSTIWNWTPYENKRSLPLSSYRALYEYCYATGNLACFNYSAGLAGPCRKYGIINMQKCILKWLENERDEACNALLDHDLIPDKDILCIISGYIFHHAIIEHRHSSY